MLKEKDCDDQEENDVDKNKKRSQLEKHQMKLKGKKRTKKGL